MKILWDERKRSANLIKHGFDFASVGEFDWSHAVIEPAKPDRFGRGRFKAIAPFGDGIAAIIFVLLGNEAISIISFRHASVKERRRLEWAN